MACYCDAEVRYRGRLFRTTMRYCVQMTERSWKLVKGKPLRLSERDHLMLKGLLDQQDVSRKCRERSYE